MAVPHNRVGFRPNLPAWYVNSLETDLRVVSQRIAVLISQNKRNCLEHHALAIISDVLRTLIRLGPLQESIDARIEMRRMYHIYTTVMRDCF